MENTRGGEPGQRRATSRGPEPFRFDNVLSRQGKLLQRCRIQKKQLLLKLASVIIQPVSHLINDGLAGDAGQHGDVPLVKSIEIREAVRRYEETRGKTPVSEDDNITAQCFENFEFQELLSLDRLLKSELKQAAGKNVNDVAIMGSSFGKVIVELSTLVFVI